MRCETFEDRLQQLLDRHERPEEDAPLAEHASSCAACREVLEVQAGLFDTVRDWSVAGLEVDLVDRVLAKVQPAVRPAGIRLASADLQPRGAAALRRSVRRFGPPLAVAAAIVVALLVWRAGQQTPQAVNPPSANELIVHTPRPQEADLSGDDLSDAAVVFMARKLGTRMANGLGYVKTGRLGETIELPEPVAAGLRPLRHTMAAALGALRKTLPIKSQRPDTESSSQHEVTAITGIMA